MKKPAIALFLIILSILLRTVWHIGPNIEFVTTASLLAGLYLGKRWAFIVPFVSIVLSDLFMGNKTIYLFTWSAYLLIGLGSAVFSLFANRKPFRKVINAGLFGLGAGFFFYLFTNFGVWLLDSWNMYPDTVTGLIQSYVMGLPFLRFTLTGNIVFAVMSVGSIEYVFPLLKSRFLLSMNRYMPLFKTADRV